MKGHNTIIRIIIMFALVPSLFFVRPTFSVELSNYAHVVQDVQIPSDACSCFGALLGNFIVKLLQGNTCNSLVFISKSSTYHYIPSKTLSFTSSNQVNLEDVYYDIFKPPKM